MYVNPDRGFGLVAFHFDPKDCAELTDKGLTGVELFSQVIAKSELSAGEIIHGEDGTVNGAANVARVLYDIQLVVLETLKRRVDLIETVER